MDGVKEFIIRKVQPQDMAQLKTFFIKAYGEDTIFQSKPFLEWYFNSDLESFTFMKNCIIGVCSNGEIISHYGGLDYTLTVGDQNISLVWGVNAFTLPEWRGKGVNSEIVTYINVNNDVNGVIGFTEDTSKFYKSIGYNLLDFERFSRYIYIIDGSKTIEVSKSIGQDLEKFAKFNLDNKVLKESTNNYEIIKLDKNNIDDFDIDFEVNVSATTRRDKKFINWRLLQNPFIDYHVYGVLYNKTIIAYVAYREEILYPLKYNVNRIIDLFGCPQAIDYLLDFVIKKSIENEYIYIDFSMFGSLYNKTLVSHNFQMFEGEELGILPQVTAPVGYRPNHEYVCLNSKKYKANINILKKEDVYFTRIDSDRDRLARYSQIKTGVKNNE